MENNERIDFAEVFKKRTKKFVVDNIKFFRTLPKTEEAKIVGRQLLHLSSSVGANYRSAGRARSKVEFHSKLSTVVEEADESIFWMEVLIDPEIVNQPAIDHLLKEGNEILKSSFSIQKNCIKQVKINN